MALISFRRHDIGGINIFPVFLLKVFFNYIYIKQTKKVAYIYVFFPFKSDIVGPEVENLFSTHAFSLPIRDCLCDKQR